MADSLVWLSGAAKTIVSLPFINEPTRTEFTYYLSQVDQIIETGVYPVHEIVRHYRFLSALAGRDISPEAPVITWRDQPPPTIPSSDLLTINQPAAKVWHCNLNSEVPQLLSYLEGKEGVSLSKIQRDMGYQRKELVNLLTKLVQFNVVEMQYSETSSSFRLSENPG